MSQMGQKAKSPSVYPTSGLPPRTEVGQSGRHVRKVPSPEVAGRAELKEIAGRK